MPRALTLGQCAHQYRETRHRQQRYTNEQYEREAQRGMQSDTNTHHEDSSEKAYCCLLVVAEGAEATTCQAELIAAHSTSKYGPMSTNFFEYTNKEAAPGWRRTKEKIRMIFIV
jgi:hypothetical protein